MNLQVLSEAIFLRLWRADGDINNPVFPLMQQILDRVGGRQWLTYLAETKVTEQDLFDYSTNNEYGMLKNTIFLLTQTLSEVGGEEFFVPLCDQV